MKVLTHGFCTSFHFQNHHSGRSALILENGLNLFNDTFADALCLFIRLICNNIDLLNGKLNSDCIHSLVLLGLLLRLDHPEALALPEEREDIIRDRSLFIAGGERRILVGIT